MTSIVGAPNVFWNLAGFKLSKFFETAINFLTLEDVMTNVETWRTQHAVGVLSAIAQIFSDVNVDTGLLTDCNEVNFEMEWEEVRDDPSFLSMMDSQDWGYCDTDTSMESNTPMNNSSFLRNLQ